MKQTVVGGFPESQGNLLPDHDRRGWFLCKLPITPQFVQCLQVIHVTLGIELMKQIAQPDPSPASRDDAEVSLH